MIITSFSRQKYFVALSHIPKIMSLLHFLTVKYARILEVSLLGELCKIQIHEIHNKTISGYIVGRVQLLFYFIKWKKLYFLIFVLQNANLDVHCFY